MLRSFKGKWRPCFKNRKRLEKLYDATQDKYEEETNLIKIIKGLRDLKHIQEHMPEMNANTQFAVLHALQN